MQFSDNILMSLKDTIKEEKNELFAKKVRLALSAILKASSKVKKKQLTTIE
jgi:hypothetical protein